MKSRLSIAWWFAQSKRRIILFKIILYFFGYHKNDRWILPISLMIAIPLSVIPITANSFSYIPYYIMDYFYFYFYCVISRFIVWESFFIIKKLTK